LPAEDFLPLSIAFAFDLERVVLIVPYSLCICFTGLRSLSLEPLALLSVMLTLENESYLTALSSAARVTRPAALVATLEP